MRTIGECVKLSTELKLKKTCSRLFQKGTLAPNTTLCRSLKLQRQWTLKSAHRNALWSMLKNIWLCIFQGAKNYCALALAAFLALASASFFATASRPALLKFSPLASAMSRIMAQSF